MTTERTQQEREPEDYPSIDDAYKALPRETRLAILSGDLDAIETWKAAAGYVEGDEA